MKKEPPQIGSRFGNWVVISNNQKSPNGRKNACLCQCSCGNTGTVTNSDLWSGHSKSCGCRRREIGIQRSKSNSNGEGGTRLYKIWEHMRTRCYNNKHPHFNNYGGRGISVCDEWRSDFWAFKTWAMENGYSDKLSIDRIDTNGNYEPSNCRWATNEEQQNNTRFNRNITLYGKTQGMSRWARELNIPVSTIYSRIKSGWDEEKALTYPVDKRKSTKKRNATS